MRSLIDYDGDHNEVPEKLTFQGTKNYWIEKKREVSGQNYIWNIKDQTLLSRLMKEYSSEQIVLMIDFYLKWNPHSTFGALYKSREYVYQQINIPEDYGFN